MNTDSLYKNDGLHGLSKKYYNNGNTILTDKAMEKFVNGVGYEWRNNKVVFVGPDIKREPDALVMVSYATRISTIPLKDIRNQIKIALIG